MQRNEDDFRYVPLQPRFGSLRTAPKSTTCERFVKIFAGGIFRFHMTSHSATSNQAGASSKHPSPAEALSALGLVLPAAPKPVASYIPCVWSGSLIFVSGQLPMRDGALIATGSCPAPVTVEVAQQCARQCVLNGLAVVADALGGSLDRVERIVRLGVFVSSSDGFADQPKVANGASELLQQIFGERGRHARAAVGVNALPLGACVEVEMTVEVR